MNLKDKTFLPIGVASVLIVLAICWRILLSPEKRTVTLSKKHTVESMLNVHGSAGRDLKVCGYTFENVLGASPCFLLITGTSSILFVHKNSSAQKFAVLLDTNQCTFLKFPLNREQFGQGIGFWEKSNGEIGDAIESTSSNSIILISKTLNHTERLELNLTNSLIRVIEAHTTAPLIELK